METVLRILSALWLCLFLLTAPAAAQPAQRAEAVFAGGCFWCVESDFEHLDGVIEAVSGYTGGTSRNPTYEDHEGHYEAVRVIYDPARVTYRQLVDFFFRHIDPTDAGGQFCDRGPSYRTAIFVTPAQRGTAEAAREAAQQALPRGEIVTPILPLTQFWNAEAYHQNYARRNGVLYRFYRLRCGRDARVRQVWGRR
ncbi:MAG: peptide-methionine (S)-S-oxide reductase MsrA [Hyphomonadaceae bacterium]